MNTIVWDTVFGMLYILNYSGPKVLTRLRILIIIVITQGARYLLLPAAQRPQRICLGWTKQHAYT